MLIKMDAMKDHFFKKNVFYVLILAFFIQILRLYYHEWGEAFVSSYSLSDAELYLHYAWMKAFITPNGGILGEIIPPSPYVLIQTLAYKALGFYYYTPYISNAFLMSVSAALMYLLGKNLFNKKTGFFSAIIFIFCGPLLFYSGLTMKTISAIFFLCASLYFLERSLKTKQPIFLLLLSTSLALLILERNNFLLEAPLVLLIAFIKPVSKSLIIKRLICLITPGLLIVFLFNSIFNQAHSTSPIGVNFYIGNSIKSSGAYIRLAPEVHDDLIGSHQDPILFAEKALNQELSNAEANIYWLKRTLDDITSNPVHFTKITARKVLMLLSRDVPGSPEQFALWRWQDPILSLAIFDHGLILALAIIGVFLAKRSASHEYIKIFMLIPLIYSITVVLFFVIERYRFPVMIALIPFAGFTLSTVLNHIYSKLSATIVLTAIALYGTSLLLNNINPIGPGWSAYPTKKRVELLNKATLNKFSYIYKRKALETDEARYWRLLSQTYSKRRMPTDAKIFFDKIKEETE